MCVITNSSICQSKLPFPLRIRRSSRPHAAVLTHTRHPHHRHIVSNFDPLIYIYLIMQRRCTLWRRAPASAVAATKTVGARHATARPHLHIPHIINSNVIVGLACPCALIRLSTDKRSALVGWRPARTRWKSQVLLTTSRSLNTTPSVHHVGGCYFNGFVHETLVPIKVS